LLDFGVPGLRPNHCGREDECERDAVKQVAIQPTATLSIP
jgi:hypothetical protein